MWETKGGGDREEGEGKQKRQKGGRTRSKRKRREDVSCGRRGGMVVKLIITLLI